jgi:hypothetical protein
LTIAAAPHVTGGRCLVGGLGRSALLNCGRAVLQGGLLRRCGLSLQRRVARLGERRRSDTGDFGLWVIGRRLESCPRTRWDVHTRGGGAKEGTELPDSAALWVCGSVCASVRSNPRPPTGVLAHHSGSCSNPTQATVKGKGTDGGDGDGRRLGGRTLRVMRLRMSRRRPSGGDAGAAAAGGGASSSHRLHINGKTLLPSYGNVAKFMVGALGSGVAGGLTTGWCTNSALLNVPATSRPPAPARSGLPPPARQGCQDRRRSSSSSVGPRPSIAP